MEVVELRRYLFDTYDGHLTLEQIELIDKAIHNRLKGEMEQKDFRKFLDEPLNKGGVGLNRRTVKNISKQLELILAEKA